MFSQWGRSCRTQEAPASEGEDRQLADTRTLLKSHQREVVRVDPDDAEVGVVRVIFCHLLQDVKELKSI